MTVVNTAKFEESTEIVIDTEVEVPAAGWTVDYCSVNRVGSLVAVHLEAAFAAHAASHVLTLQGDFAPGATVTSPDGKFTIGANGVVTFTGDTSAGGTAVCQLVYQAGEVSP